MKLWGKGNKLNREAERFTVGNDYLLDMNLLKHDIAASIAHAEMLEKIGILTNDELARLKKGLNEIDELHKKGKFKISLQEEDCHTAIENYLTKKLGSLGKKIHTGRSRNDQVLAALRLYTKEEIDIITAKTLKLVLILKEQASRSSSIQVPGYSHMQKAMPSSIGLWLGAFTEALEDDLKLISAVKELNDQSPLGSAAGFGVPLEIDREYAAKKLGFKKVQQNTLYVQNSRGKFELMVLAAISQVMLDLNKLATDMLLFSTAEFGFISLPEELTTGSSIMPHKRNPDVLEIIRAKNGVISGHYIQISSIISNLPSGYNRDFQLTKEPYMKSIDTVKDCIDMMALAVKGMGINKEKCKSAMTQELYATKKIYELVKKNIPFREAYKKVKDEL